MNCSDIWTAAKTLLQKNKWGRQTLCFHCILVRRKTALLREWVSMKIIELNVSALGNHSIKNKYTFIFIKLSVNVKEVDYSDFVFSVQELKRQRLQSFIDHWPEKREVASIHTQYVIEFGSKINFKEIRQNVTLLPGGDQTRRSIIVRNVLLEWSSNRSMWHWCERRLETLLRIWKIKVS